MSVCACMLTCVFVRVSVFVHVLVDSQPFVHVNLHQADVRKSDVY